MICEFHSFSPYTVSLVALEGTVQRLGRFANYLRAIIPHPDVSLTEMVAKAIGQLALCEGNYTAGMCICMHLCTCSIIIVYIVVIVYIHVVYI